MYFKVDPHKQPSDAAYKTWYIKMSHIYENRIIASLGG